MKTPYDFLGSVTLEEFLSQIIINDYEEHSPWMLVNLMVLFSMWTTL